MLSFIPAVGSCFGLRTFISIVVQRFGTLRRIAPIVDAKGGTGDDIRRRRRRAFLISEMKTLVIDLSRVFITTITASYLLFGTTFNSWKFAIHKIALGIPATLVALLSTVHLNSKFKKTRLQSGMYAKKSSAGGRANAKVRPGESMQDDSSVAHQCDI